MNERSKLRVEQIALGELDVERTPELSRELAELERSNHAILENYPAERLVPVIAREARARLLRQRSWLWVAPVAAVATIALGLAIFPPPDSADDLRIKGLEPVLSIHLQRGQSSERLVTGAEVREHDMLQMRYAAAGRKHGVILSVDGRGEVTLHFPETAKGSTLLGGAGEVALPYAYELDDAPRFERFVFVTSNRPLSVDSVLEAARALDGESSATAPLVLPSDAEQTSFFLRKVNR